jgi:mannose-6-phosphate isomerase-like protein (cupin superfamily)
MLRSCLTVAAVATLGVMHVGAQEQPAVPAQNHATTITAAEVKTVVAAFPGAPVGIKSVDGIKNVIDVWVDHRKAGMKATMGERGETHTELTEIYYIVAGKGTLATGGKIVDPQFMKPGAQTVPGTQSFRAPTFVGKYEGGEALSLTAGDIVILPPGTVHQWIAIDSAGDLTFVNARVDSGRKQAPGFVSPALKK